VRTSGKTGKSKKPVKKRAKTTTKPETKTRKKRL
jgi:hypothetical protein